MPNRQISHLPKKWYNWYRCLGGPIDKVSWLTEMGCLQSWVSAIIPYRDQFLLQQEHHVISVFLRGQTKKDPANMCSHGEIHFVLIFGFLLFDDGTVDQHFRHVVCNKVCPYFLFDILWCTGSGQEHEKTALFLLQISEPEKYHWIPWGTWSRCRDHPHG